MNLDLVKSIADDIVAAKDGWEMIRYIDAGASGAVFEIQHPEHGRTALKVYDPKFFEGGDALIEVRRVELQEDLKGHGNKYLIEIFEAEAFEPGATYFLLMQLCPWDSLDKHVSNLPDDQVQELLRQLVEAVSFLDSRQLVHRDIKPANIAIAPDFSELKLLDLGVLRKIGPSEGAGTDINEKKRFVATAQYSPPEYLAREEATGEEGFDALNVYQVGAVLHDMIMKRPLFAEEAETLNRYILYRAITSKRPLIFNANLPSRLISLCRAALEKDARKRLASVKLSDLAQPIDSAEAVRRRLAAQRPAREADVTGPSLTIWAGQVKRWIKSALTAERDVLGPSVLSEVPGAEARATWRLKLPSINRSLTLSLRRADDGAYLVLVIVGDGAAEGASLLEIYANGPGVDSAAIKEQLREQILFAIDAADSDPENAGDDQ